MPLDAGHGPLHLHQAVVCLLEPCTVGMQLPPQVPQAAAAPQTLYQLARCNSADSKPGLVQCILCQTRRVYNKLSALNLQPAAPMEGFQVMSPPQLSLTYVQGDKLRHGRSYYHRHGHELIAIQPQLCDPLQHTACQELVPATGVDVERPQRFAAIQPCGTEPAVDAALMGSTYISASSSACIAAKHTRCLHCCKTHTFQDLGLKAILASVAIKEAQPAQCQNIPVAALIQLNSDSRTSLELCQFR